MTLENPEDRKTARLVEECAEEIGRLDSLVAMSPGSLPLLLQAWTAARLATPDAQAMRVSVVALVSSHVEPVHAAALPNGLADWQRRLDDGERRARSGVPLAPPERLSLGPQTQARVIEALRPGGQPRSVLLRATQVVAEIEAAAGDAPRGDARPAARAAALPEPHADAELLAALLLTAAGMTDRVRFLPFAEFTDGRSEALEAWRAGDSAAFTQGALAALAPAARRLRVQVKLLLESRAAEDAHLDSIGRAAVTARRALAVLRDAMATSMPDLANRLDLSRPAAGAALERLVELGLAEEITGRGRDRVYVWAGAFGIG